MAPAANAATNATAIRRMVVLSSRRSAQGLYNPLSHRTTRERPQPAVRSHSAPAAIRAVHNVFPLLNVKIRAPSLGGGEAVAAAIGFWEESMKKERTIEELYALDPERADAQAFGRKTGLDRRGFL